MYPYTCVLFHTVGYIYTCASYIYLLDRFYGVMVSMLDFESSDPSSNFSRTYFCRGEIKKNK